MPQEWSRGRICVKIERGACRPGRVLTPVGSAFGATAHDAAHGAFMKLAHYPLTKESEVHEQGFGVSNGAHPVRSRPVEASSESMEREGPATSAEETARCASRGKSGSNYRFIHEGDFQLE